jgi:hypothetical protein
VLEFACLGVPLLQVWWLQRQQQLGALLGPHTPQVGSPLGSLLLLLLLLQALKVWSMLPLTLVLLLLLVVVLLPWACRPWPAPVPPLVTVAEQLLPHPVQPLPCSQQRPPA